jgi:AcrR family transcriptional regulator
LEVLVAVAAKEKARASRRAHAERLGAADWVETARTALIGGGVARVRVEPLARALGVTTGSFYWHFKDREALLGALLRHWEETNTAPLFRAVEAAGDAAAQLSALVEVWIDEADYSPAYDSAVRDWARVSETAEAAVRRVDDKRIGLLQRIFEGFGHDAERAFVRARVAYFHQVGYYALHIVESREERRRLLPLYLEVLTGAA